MSTWAADTVKCVKVITRCSSASETVHPACRKCHARCFTNVTISLFAVLKREASEALWQWWREEIQLPDYPVLTLLYVPQLLKRQIKQVHTEKLATCSPSSSDTQVWLIRATYRSTGKRVSEITEIMKYKSCFDTFDFLLFENDNIDSYSWYKLDQLFHSYTGQMCYQCNIWEIFQSVVCENLSFML